MLHLAVVEFNVNLSPLAPPPPFIYLFYGVFFSLFFVTVRNKVPVKSRDSSSAARHLRRRLAGDGALSFTVPIKVERDKPMTCAHPPGKLCISLT